ncbi:coenzyme F420-0:L-glutamate ligase [Nocardioides sp. GCM10027113]|uniref:coenzyme F420-0:L-glutamate ligase n=1 Tax=unclassified Nocardioides TaxID=2615069 RepID=UPI0036114963
MTSGGATVSVTAPDGVPEVRPGDDLAKLLLAVATPRHGDVVVVTSKVVSKAEGRLADGAREDALAGETVRVVARRGPTTIVRTRHGLTLAAAGIDASNVEAGRLVLLPTDPDRSARALREAVLERTGANVGVVVTDTAGRAWREGQTDLAIGVAGLVVLERYAGRHDAHGNPLAVTAPAVADEIASMAELAQGKLAGRPFAVVTGRADLVLPPGEHGEGAAALVRPEAGDMFGYGAREAVVRALVGDPADRAPFGTPVPAEELAAVLAEVCGGRARVVPGGADGADHAVVLAGNEAPGEVLRTLAFAHGWAVDGDDSATEVRFRPFAT